MAIPWRKMGIFVSLFSAFLICPLPQKWFWVKRFSKFVNWLSQGCKVWHILSVYNLDTCKGKSKRGVRANVVGTCPQTGQESKLRNNWARCWKEACENPHNMCSDPYSLWHFRRNLPRRNTWFISFLRLSPRWQPLFFVLLNVAENPAKIRVRLTFARFFMTNCIWAAKWAAIAVQTAAQIGIMGQNDGKTDGYSRSNNRSNWHNGPKWRHNGRL